MVAHIFTAYINELHQKCTTDDCAKDRGPGEVDLLSSVYHGSSQTSIITDVNIFTV